MGNIFCDQKNGHQKKNHGLYDAGDHIGDLQEVGAKQNEFTFRLWKDTFRPSDALILNRYAMDGMKFEFYPPTQKWTINATLIHEQTVVPLRTELIFPSAAVDAMVKKYDNGLIYNDTTAVNRGWRSNYRKFALNSICRYSVITLQQSDHPHNDYFSFRHLNYDIFQWAFSSVRDMNLPSVSQFSRPIMDSFIGLYLPKELIPIVLMYYRYGYPHRILDENVSNIIMSSSLEHRVNTDLTTWQVVVFCRQVEKEIIFSLIDTTLSRMLCNDQRLCHQIYYWENCDFDISLKLYQSSVVVAIISRDLLKKLKMDTDKVMYVCYTVNFTSCDERFQKHRESLNTLFISYSPVVFSTFLGHRYQEYLRADGFGV